MNKENTELFVVTGGTRGIGRSIAEAAQLDGRYQVVVVSKNSSEDIPAHWLQIRGDLSVLAEVASVGQQLNELSKPIGVLVNCAGSIYDEKPLVEVSASSLTSSMNLHCFAPLILANALKESLEAAKSPSIINIGSIYGSVVDVDVASYVLSKSPMPLLTSMMAKAYAPRIRVNAILPGHIDTDMTRSAPADFITPIIDKTPLKRLGSAEEIARVAMFLASHEASFITGSALRVDGGYWSTAP